MDYFVEEYKKLPRWTFEEAVSLFLFVLATLAAFTRQFYSDYLQGLKPAYVFIICGILSFCIHKRRGGRLMEWKSVQRKIAWDLIYIFAGGLAAGTLINGSGAASDIGQCISHMGLDGGLTTIFVFITVPLLLSDITSNTATAAITIPIVISIVQGIGGNPIPYIYIASIGVNLSYMFPTSIRAIPVGYGLSPKYMLHEGFKLTIVVAILMTVVGWLLLKYWPAYQTA